MKYSMNLKLSQHRSTALEELHCSGMSNAICGGPMLTLISREGTSKLSPLSLLVRSKCNATEIGTHTTRKSLRCLSNPCLPRFLVRAEAFQETRNRCIYFLNAEYRTPFALAYDGVVSRRSHKKFGSSPSRWNLRFLLVSHGASYRPTEIRPWSVAGCARGGR